MAGGPSGAGWRGKGGGKANAANPNWRKVAPTSAAAGGSTRTVKLLALGGCAVAVVVGMVFLFQYLAKPQRAGLIAIAGDPGSAARLDVPYDPAGWLSADRLLKAVTGSADADADADAKTIGPVPGATKPLFIDDNEWLDALGRDSMVDPVVIYVGLVGGVNRQGDPILYTGRADRPAVKLADILARLKDRVEGKQKVLVLDAGRQVPDPNLGEIAPDFARAVREKLAVEIANSPNLAVILATGDEARAWDSPDRGMTMLSHALRAGLLGGARREGIETFRVSELSKYVADTVAKDSANERPTKQLPVLMPPADEWTKARTASFENRPFYTPPAPATFDAPVGPPEAPTHLTALWDDAARLATTRPGPWVYTPVAWRRYRELLLRYEQGVVAGDTEGLKVLDAAIKVESKRIEDGTGVKLAESGQHALPLSAALGQSWPAAAGVTAALNSANSLETLAKKLKDVARVKDRPPTEAHLPLMLHHYVTQVVPPPSGPSLEMTWRHAVASRHLAEQAALSATVSGTFPSSERVWPVVRATVVQADEARRRGEDRMLSDAAGDKSKSAGGEFAAAKVGYEAALKAAAVLQSALAARDEAYADLPFLSRWANEVETLTSGADPNVLAGEVEKAWQATHALADAVEKALEVADPAGVKTAALNGATAEVNTALAGLRAVVAAEAQSPNRSETQTNWLALQHLSTLPVPLVAATDRRANFQTARKMAGQFKATTAQAGDRPPTVPPAKTARRLRTTSASLGGPWTRWVSEQTVLTPAPKSDWPTATLTDTSQASALAFSHRARQADFADPAKPDEAEAVSRLAAPFQAAAAEYEPAALNARRRWATLLEALARRAALDHWFGEDNQPYLTAFAQDYLDDAAKLKDPARPPEASADATDARKLIAAAAAPWKYDPVAGDRLSGGWTTEAENRFAYKFNLGEYESLQKLLPAEAVVWATTATVSGKATLVLDVAATRPRPVSWQAGADARGASVLAECKVPLEERTGKARLTAAAYFRGHVERAPQDIDFDGRPHVVQTDLQPPPRAAIALRADVDPGAVAVLIDYSGSMTENWQGSKDTKKEVLIRLLSGILDKLPSGTQLSVRVMREDKVKMTASERIYPLAGQVGFIGLQPEDPARIIAMLKATAPDGPTPLVPTMELTTGDFPKNYAGVKTMIVITDGADTSRIKDATPNNQAYMKVEDMSDEVKVKLIEAVKGDVVRHFGRSNASVQMVVFGASDAELKLAKEMFEPLERFVENPGRIIVAEDEGTLRREILESLLPRVKLLDAGTKQPVLSNIKRPHDLPRIGIPANSKSAGLAGDTPLWRGSLQAQSYYLKYLNNLAELRLAGGDAIVVRLRRTEGESKYEFERECYYRDVLGKKPEVAGDRAAANGTHFLHVPNYGVGNPGSGYSYLAAVASLDRVDSLKPGRDGDALSVGQPAAHWWEVRRTLPGAKEATRYDKSLSVWNAFGLVASSWRLVTDGVRKAEDLTKGPAFQLAVWPAERTLSPLGRVSFSNANLIDGEAKRFAGVRVRAKLEPMVFLGSKYPENPKHQPFPAALTAKPQRCLVLRIDNDPDGRLLRAKVDWKGENTIVARQHLYYFHDPKVTVETAKVKAYTVIVGPLPEGFDTARDETVVELLDLGEAVRRVPTRRLDLDLGVPSDDRAALHTLPFPLDQ